MKCDNIKKWIHLNKTDELTETEKNKLKEHLNNCDSCRELLESVENADKLIRNLKTFEPELTYPQILTSNIMQSIVNSKKSNSFSFLLSGIVEMLFSNKVKILAYTIVIGLISLFSYQQLFIINKLDQMERKIAMRSEQNSELLRTPSIINNKLLKQFASGFEDEQIVLNKRSLEQFLESYKDLKTDHDDLLELLNDNIKNLERKLSKNDIKKLKQLLREDDLEKNLSTNL
jgi:hypothetical protein